MSGIGMPRVNRASGTEADFILCGNSQKFTTVDVMQEDKGSLFGGAPREPVHHRRSQVVVAALQRGAETNGAQADIKLGKMQ